MPRKQLENGLWVNIEEDKDPNVEQDFQKGSQENGATAGQKLVAPENTESNSGPGFLDYLKLGFKTTLASRASLNRGPIGTPPADNYDSWKESEDERKSQPDFVADRNALEESLRTSVFSDKYFLKEHGGSENLTSIQNNNDFGDVRVKIKENLGTKGFSINFNPTGVGVGTLMFNKGTEQTTYPSLTEKDVDDAITQVMHETISKEREAADTKMIDKGVSKLTRTNEDLKQQLSDLEDIDINALNKNEKELATLLKQIRNKEESGLDNQQVADLIERAEVIGSTIKDTFGEDYKFFYDPLTGNNLTEAEAKEFAEKNPSIKNIGDKVQEHVAELSVIKDQDLLLNKYNDLNLGLVGHREEGNKTYDVWIDSQGVTNLLKEKGYSMVSGDNPEYSEKRKKLMSARDGDFTKGVLFKDVKLKDIAVYSDRFKDDGTFSTGQFLAGAGSDNFIIPVFNDETSMTEKQFEDYLVRYNDQGYDLAAQKRAMKDVFLLNRDPSTIGKAHIVTLAEAASNSLFGEKYTQGQVGFSNRKVLDLASDIYAETGITLSDDQEDALARSLGDDIAEGFGGAASILVQLYGLNKMQGVATGMGALGRVMAASKAPRYMRGSKILTQANIQKRARVLGISEADYAKKYGLTAISASRSAKLKGHIINVMFEEAKMAGALDFDIGTGAGFYLGGQMLPYTFKGAPAGYKGLNLTTKYNQLNTVNELLFKNSTAFAIGTKFGGLLESTIKDLEGEETVQSYLEETYGDYDVLQRQTLLDLALGSAFGATHLKVFGKKGLDSKRTTSIAKIKNEAAKKYKEASEKLDFDAMAKHQEVYNMAHHRLAAMDKIDLYTNPSTAKSAYEKLTKGIKKAFGGKLEIEVNDGKNLENKNAQGEYMPKKNNNGKGKIIINYKNAEPGVVPHEGIHAGFDVLFEGNVALKQKFQRKLEDVAADLVLTNKQGESASLLDIIKAEKSISEFKKPEELMAYMAEFLSKAEYYNQLVAGNAFSNIKQNLQRFSESNLGIKPRLVTTQDVVNFLGRYVENVKKGYNPIKQLERLQEMVELAEIPPNPKSRDASIKLEKSELLKQNAELIKNKPEGWRDKNKVIADKIRSLNELIASSDKNADLVGKYRDLDNLIKERGENVSANLRKSNIIEQLRENNKGILTEFIKEGFVETPGSEVTRQRFTEEVMNMEFLLNVNSYFKPKKNGKASSFEQGVPFGAYLRQNLFGPYFKKGSGKPQRQGNVLKRIQGGKTQDASIKTVSISDPNVMKTVEGFGEGLPVYGGSRKYPKDVIEGSEGIRLERDLKVAPEQIKDIKSKFDNMLSNPKKVAQLDFKKLQDLSPEFTADLFGGKGFSKLSKQQKADFIGENWKTLYEMLPLGAFPTTGKSTGVSTSLQTSQKTGADIFYTKGESVKFAETGSKQGLEVQTKIEMGKAEFLEKLGIESYFEANSTKELYRADKMNRNHETTIKALMKEAGRNITNQTVRDYLTAEKYNENPKLAEEISREQLLHNIATGKSESLQSLNLLARRFEENLGKKPTQIELLQIIGGFQYKTLDELKQSLGEKKFKIVKDWIENESIVIAEEGRSALQYVKAIKSKNIPNIGNAKWWTMSDAKFKKSKEGKKWFAKTAFDIAQNVPLGGNLNGNVKLILDLFTGHYNIVGSEYAKVESAFKKGIKKRLGKKNEFVEPTKENEAWMSRETYDRWINFDFANLTTSYASSFKTGYKKILAEPDLAKQKEIAKEVFLSKDGKLAIEMYDLWNTTLQEWIGKEVKDSPAYWNKADYILKIKKANSAIGVTGERIYAPPRYAFLPGKVVEGTIKYEHLKSSSQQSLESAMLLLNNQWKSQGKKGLKEYGGIYGLLSDFNMVDAATGKVNSTDIFRLAKNLELAKDIYSVESGFKKSLYEDMIAEYGKKAIDKIKKTAENKLKDDVLQSIRLVNSGPIGKGKKRKGISVFDFDDTLAKTNSQVIVTMPNGKVMKINATEFAKQDAALTKKGAKYDFSEFSKVIDGKKGPLFDLAMKRQDKFTSKDIFILTARPQEAALSIHKFLKGIGLEVPMKNITGLADGTPQAKANWVLGKAKKGYNDFYFADDAYKNVKAVGDVLKTVDVKGKVQQALQSLDLNKKMNDMLENRFGVKSQAVYSKVKAMKLGQDKGKGGIIPYSHQDFIGLMYPLLGKGKVGDANLKWIKESFVNPFARAEMNMTSDRIQLTSNFRAIKRRLKAKGIPKNLRKKAVDGFTFGDVIRIYAWQKQGMEIPGMSKGDLRSVLKFAELKPEIKEFASELIQLNLGEGYPKPGEFWANENITTDLMKGLNEGRRAKYLEQWKQNVEQTFTENVFNKLEAQLGPSYVTSLKNMLARMESGRNRQFSGGKMGKLESQFTDWVNNSVGTIMFFNTRSAVLQTISNVNYINWADNNPLKAGKALANQPQYWRDVMELMNSDYLVNRRGGLKINVSESEIADAASTSKNKFKGALNYILKKGFLPTQYADSFAISTGGATLYRNRINTYRKQGLSEAEAKKKAFEDFQQITEETQQSSRADMISMQQASTLGRLVLAFGNTPSQYARLMDKAAKDLVNGRGDWKTNMSKVIYYGAIQNFIFNALQNALFKTMFDEDDDDKASARELRIANGMADSVLRGTGVVGAGVSMLKNMILEFDKQSKKKNPKYRDVALKVLDISPPIDSKVSKLRSAGMTLDYNMDEIKEKGFSLDNPAYLAAGQVTSALVNLPLDRLFKKYNNLEAAMRDDTENWQAIALSMGWSEWELGMNEKEKTKSAKRFIYNQRKKSKKKRLIAPKN